MDAEGQGAFNKVKENFIYAPTLALFNPELEKVLETDFSGWAMGACLLQWDGERKIKPIGFFSKKLSSAECNNDVYERVISNHTSNGALEGRANMSSLSTANIY